MSFDVYSTIVLEDSKHKKAAQVFSVTVVIREPFYN
jgi:hypothetical protein